MFLLLGAEALQRQENVAKVVAPMIQLAEDHQHGGRLAGAQCMRHLLLNGNMKLLEQCGIAELFYRLLMASLAFDDAQLFVVSWEALLAICADVSSAVTQKRIDEMLVFIVQEIRVARVSVLVPMYLEQLNKMLASIGILAVAHLSEVLLMLDHCAAFGSADVADGASACLAVVGRECWPRMGTKQILVDGIRESVNRAKS